SRDIIILAFDPDKPVFNLSGVDQALDTIRRSNMVLFDRLSRSEYGSIAAEIEQGKSISTEINGRKIQVGGLFALGGGVMSADGLLISSDLNFLRIIERSLSEIDLGLITLESGANLKQVRRQLTSNLPEDVKVMTKQEFLDFEQSYWKIVRQLVLSLALAY
ncbi:MAG: ABC transporter, partial [Pleurocapsa sp. CRU_1_2]|nr:ABC transporter [Pleurocapsa sp. CRU_1_2]